MDNKKFIETFDVDDYEVLTEDGFKDITHVHKTIEFQVYEIKTKDFYLHCADEHIIIDENDNEVFAKDLSIGDRIKTENGIQPITIFNILNKSENMYDISIDSKKHTFYTNGILSHNSTISTIYLLWYILFHKDKFVAILANKEKTSIEILRRLKFAYQNLPLWLQQGIIDAGWNKQSISLENGCRVIAASTASSAIRGESIALLLLDEFAFVPTNIASDFMQSVYPTISSGKTSKIIVVSTPNGLNHYFSIWRKSVRGENNFKPIKIKWNEVPSRTDEWKEEVIRDIGIVKWNAEYGCATRSKDITTNIRNKKTGKIIQVSTQDLPNVL